MANEFSDLLFLEGHFETEKYFNVLSMAGRLFRTLNKKLLDGIKDDKYLNTQIKAFANFKIRQGMPIGNVNSHVVGLIRYLQNKFNFILSSILISNLKN